MINYEIITLETFIGGTGIDYVVITRDDDSIEMFPVDESNPRYIQFLEETA